MRWLLVLGATAACSLEPPTDVPDDAADVDATDAPPDVDAPDAPPDAVDAPDAPVGPSLTSAAVPLRIEVSDTVPITLVIAGPPSTTVAWTITTGGGSFAPSAGNVATTAGGVGMITTSYTAPALPGDRAHTLTLTAGTSTDTLFDTRVRTLEGAGELTPFSDNAGISVPANYLYGQQVFVPRDVVMMKLGLNTQVGGFAGRMALYTNVGGAPGALVVASPLTQLVVGPNDLRVTPTMVPSGTYWLLGNFAAQAAIKRNPSSNTTLSYVIHQTGDALPDPATGFSTTNNRVLNYHLRFAD